MDGSITGVLLQWGIGGVAILAEAFVIKVMWDYIKQLQKEKEALMEARRVDAINVVNHNEMLLTELATNMEFMAKKMIIARPGKD